MFPAHDNILTDLVVVRIPFGQNRLLVHKLRVKALGPHQEFFDAPFRLRQGIGPLVRGVRFQIKCDCP